MPNPTGKNQYSKGGGGGRSKAGSSRSRPKGSIASQAKAISRKLQSSSSFSFDKGTNSAVHEAFIRQGLAKKAAAKKARAKRR